MKLLTLGYHIDILFLLSKKTKDGIGVLNLWHKPRHAVFLCAKSQSSLCRGWVGSRKTGRFQRPVRQPAQPRLHNWRYGVGFKNLSLESIMIQSKSKAKPRLTSLFEIVVKSPIHCVVCRDLAFGQASALVTLIPNSVVKFQCMTMEGE
jgi:hypothetical protein